MSVNFLSLQKMFSQTEPINIQPTFFMLDHSNQTHVLIFSIINLILLSVLFQQYNLSKDKRFKFINLIKYTVLAGITSVLLAFDIIFISNLVNAYL